jgi:hypothetical protein
MPERADVVTVAVPCRADEPSLGRTLSAAAASWRASGRGAAPRVEVLVCLNGAEASGPLADLRRFAAEAGAPVVELDLDRGPAPAPPPAAALTVAALLTHRTGKPAAWNALRQRAQGEVAIFLDADVRFGPEAFGGLLDALAAHPRAVLASAKTTCAPRPGAFERIMATPYEVDFPNLSAQLYAARLGALPVALPEDLLEPERWLELVVGREAVVRVPDVRVAVRLPGTLADFFRQRIRIEMGKVQLAREYPALAARGRPQPGPAAVLARLGGAGRIRLAVYLALRSAAHVIAWARYRRGDVAGVWRQAATTKRWDPA